MRASIVRGLVFALTVGLAAVPGVSEAAILQVTSCADTGAPGQLRTQIAAAATYGDTIVIPACTITLTAAAGGGLTITKSLTILGAGPGRTAVDGAALGSVFTVAGTVTVTISDLAIRNGAGDLGGGVNNGSTLTLEQVILEENDANFNGGAISTTGTGKLTLRDSTLVGNRAGLVSNAAGGGGLYVAIGGSAVVLNTTISGNSTLAGQGGGVLAASGFVTIVNSTITANHSTGTTGAGGGVAVVAAPGGLVGILSSIIADNVAPTGTENCYASGPGLLVSAGHNLDTGLTCGFVATGDLSGVNPLLGPLQNNGGPTPTHALAAASPAIDAGSTAGCPATDQRGGRRPLKATAAAPARCDMGAYEAPAAFVVTGTGAGGGPHVRVFSRATGEEIVGFMAYDPGFAGGIRVTVGDVNGDGVPDLITGAGPGGGAHVRLFDGAALLEGAVEVLGEYFAYDPGFTGGVFVAAGDLNGDGRAEVVTGPGAGGAPEVRAFRGNAGTPLVGPLGTFFPYDPGFLGGVFVGVSP
jgi:hypothetical protein